MATKANIEIELIGGGKAGVTLKELQQTSNRLKREIGDLTPGSEKFVEKTKDFQKVTGRLKNVRAEVSGVSKAQKGLNSEFLQFLPFGGKIQAITGKFGNFRGAIGGTTKGFKSLRGAIISTGIGALIILIGSLVSWLSKTQRGMEFVEKATAAVGAIFDVIIDRGSMIIDAFGALFSGDTEKGFDMLKDSVKGVGDEMVREAKLAWELKEAMIALGKQETDFTLIQAQRKRQIQELIFLTRDETKSFAERREALLEANKLELANLNESKIMQKEKIRLMELEYERAESLEEDRAALIAERVKMEEMEAASLSRQRELRNRITELDNKARADQKKRSDARLKEINEEQKAIEAANKQRIADEKAMMDELAKIEKEEQSELEKDLKRISVLRKQNQSDKLLDLEFFIAEEKIRIDDAFADRLINEEERQELLFQLEVDRLEKQIALMKGYYGEESREAKKAMQSLNSFMGTARAKDTASTIQSEDKKLDSFLGRTNASLGAAKWLQGNLSQLAEEGSKEAKTLAIFEAELAAIQAGLSSFAAGSKLGGPVLGGIWAALAFAFGQVQIAKMNSVQKAERGMVVDSLKNAVSYSSGGILSGNRHSQGGIMVNAEDGEIILNRNVGNDPAGLAMASNLNAMYGGISFMQSGGPVNPLSSSDPSYSDSGSSIVGTDISDSLNTLNNNFSRLANEISDWQRDLKVHNNVQDTRKGISVINQLEEDAGF